MPVVDDDGRSGEAEGQVCTVLGVGITSCVVSSSAVVMAIAAAAAAAANWRCCRRRVRREVDVFVGAGGVAIAAE